MNIIKNLKKKIELELEIEFKIKQERISLKSNEERLKFEKNFLKRGEEVLKQFLLI